MVEAPELSGREFHLDLDPVGDGFLLEDDESLEELDGGGLDAKEETERQVEDEDEGGDKGEDVFLDAVDGEEEQYPAVDGGGVSSCLGATGRGRERVSLLVSDKEFYRWIFGMGGRRWDWVGTE